jgi:hypothetical protein
VQETSFEMYHSFGQWKYGIQSFDVLFAELI